MLMFSFTVDGVDSSVL